MARPKVSNNNRQRMLTAGIRLLKESGYHGMSIKQLVDDIGVPKGSFYNYFPSKEDFVEQVIVCYGENSAGTIAQSLKPDTSPIERILCVFDALTQDLHTDQGIAPCLVSTLTNEISQASEKCRRSLQGVQDFATSQLTIMVKEAQTQGELTEAQPASVLAAILYNNWHGQLLQCQVHNNRVSPTQQIQQLLALLKP